MLLEFCKINLNYTDQINIENIIYSYSQFLVIIIIMIRIFFFLFFFFGFQLDSPRLSGKVIFMCNVLLQKLCISI